jgi:outer membrane protein assembly factor BamB
LLEVVSANLSIKTPEIFMRTNSLPTRSFILLSTLALAATATAGDWPQWRGSERDGISREDGLLQEWPEDGPALAWKAKGLGVGFSSVAVADGKIFSLGDLDDGSNAIALNEKDGSLLWKTRIGDSGGHGKYPGTRSTPTVDNGQVFVLNQFSDLACLDAESGKLLWEKNLEKDFGGKMMSGWKYSESPLVDGDQVVVTPGGKDGTLLALDRKTGEKIWQTGDWTDAAAYSSVIIATIHGTRQYVQLTGESVAGVDPESGKMLWKAERKGKTAVVATPVVEDDLLFVTSSYGVGCNGFRISKKGDQWTTEQLYANKEIGNHHGGVVLIDGHVFGGSGSTFRCLNLESGELNFAERSAGKGATLFADQRFYLRAEDGPMALIKASPEGYTEVSRFEQPDRSDYKAWAHPVVANGKLYLRDQDVLLCYDVSAK